MCLSEIAVFLGGDNRTVPLNEPGTLTVFRRERGAWVRDREMAFALNAAHGFMLKHADGTATEHSARYLRELGLKPGDV